VLPAKTYERSRGNRDEREKNKETGTIIAENSSRSCARVWPTVPARSFEDFNRDCRKAAERIWNNKMRMQNERLKVRPQAR